MLRMWDCNFPKSDEYVRGVFENARRHNPRHPKTSCNLFLQKLRKVRIKSLTKFFKQIPIPDTYNLLRNGFVVP